MGLINTKITYGIIDDDISFRSMLAGLLRLKKNTEKIVEFSSAEEFLLYTNHPELSVLILDYRLPGMDGITLLGETLVRNLTIPKLMLSGFDAEKKIFEALKYGITGYMLKEELYSLDSVLEILLGGGAFITPTIALRVITFFKEIKKETENFEELTIREERIMRELASGYSPREISDSLNITLNTVRTHIRNIYKKLEVNTQIQLIKKVKENNIL